MLDMWLQGFQVAISGPNLIFLLAGTLWGLVVGALPGLGPMFAVSLAMPLTFGMPADSAIIMLAAIHASCAYGDSLASILINTPGGVGSVASCWDGFPMAQQGRAGLALGISVGGSFAGGLIGWLSLVAISPFLMALALKMGPAEYFMIGVLALSLLSMASEGNAVKGMILGGFGLLLSYIGRDPITAIERFTFGSMFLEDGLPLAAVFVGLFALPQVIILGEQGGSVTEIIEAKGGIWRGVREVLRYPVTVIRAGFMGIYMGVMPALGISAASVLAYLVEKRASKDPESFGKGNVKGLLAPEVAKNSCLVGDLIPTFTLGIPGSGVTAIFMAALILHGIQPGQDFFSKGALPYTVFVGILLAQFSFFVLGLFFAGNLAKIVRIPSAILVPVVIVLCCIGSYSIRGFMIDVTIMIVMGIVGYCLVKTKWPLPCFVLGFVLGNLLEANFQRALLIGRGSLLPFVTRPGSLIILIITVGLFAWPYIKPMFIKHKKRDLEAEKLLATLDDDENR